MPYSKVRFVFNDAASDALPPTGRQGLTFAIRTDARHATATLKTKLLDRLRQSESPPPDPERHVEQIVHGAYRDWGHNVLEVISDCLDYNRYGLQDPSDMFLNIDFYDSHQLSRKVTENAAKLAGETGNNGLSPVYVTLDDMIGEPAENWGEIAFSRVFTINGDSQCGYQGRPGKKPISDQIGDLNLMFKMMQARSGGKKIPFVLLEDNVRHAKMLNWVIGLMEQEGVFDHANLAGISTCFCCAPESERNAIRQGGNVVPMAVVVDYSDTKVDVATPRDLIFDGFVVQFEGKSGRLPGIFMDVERLFKISAPQSEQFRSRINKENKIFFNTIESKCGVTVPLSWISGAEAIAHITGKPLDTPIINVIEHQAPPPAGSRSLS